MLFPLFSRVLPLLPLLLLLLLAAPPCFAAEGAEREAAVGAEASSSAPSVKKRLTEREALILARTLAAQGRGDDAVNLYQELIARGRVQEYRIEAAFQLAGIFMLEGRFREAAILFLGILNQNPNLPRVRLELARAYFLNGDYEDAQLQFELVKGSGLPPEVQEKVDEFLTQIRRKKDWSIDFNVGLVPDSNLNQASGGSEECIALGDLLLCRPLEKKQSGIGLAAGGTLNHYLHFSRDFGLRSTISLNALDYERNDFDDYQLFLASGPRYTFEQGEISVQPTFRKRWYAGQQYSEEYGARLDAQWMLNRFVFGGSFAWGRIRYNDRYVNEFLEGDNLFSHLQVRYILNDRTFVQAGLALQRENAEVNAYGSDSLRYALGLYRVLPYGFALFGELSLTDARYHDAQSYITEDYRIDEIRREDKTWQVFASLSSSLFEKYNITPTLQYIYLKRNSNIWTQEHERQRLNLSFSYRF